MNRLTLFILCFCNLSMPLYAQSTWVKGNLEFGRDQRYGQFKSVTSRPIGFSLKNENVQRVSFSVMRFFSENSLLEVGITASKSKNLNLLAEFVDSTGYSILAGNVNKKFISLMLEYGFKISNTKNQLDVGRSFWVILFLNPYYQELNFFNPVRSIDFPAQNRLKGCSFGFTPRVLQPLGHHFLLDLSAKLNLLSFQLNSRTIENPALTPRQQSSEIFELNFLAPSLALRVGLAWKIPFRKKTVNAE